MNIIEHILHFLISVLKVLEKGLIKIFINLPARYRVAVIHTNKIKLSTKSIDPITKSLLNPVAKLDDNEFKLWSVLSAQSDSIFDIGANIGIYSLLSAKINSNAVIHSFEPNTVNAERIKLNSELNKFANINVVEKAVGINEEPLTFYVPKSNIPTAVSSNNKKFSEYWHDDLKEVAVAQTTIDAFANKIDLQKLDLVKIDVENFELNVIKGAIQTFNKFKPNILIELHLKEIINYRLNEKNIQLEDENSFEIHKMLMNMGYYLYCIGEHGLLKLESIITTEKSLNYFYSSYDSKSYYVPYNSEEIIYFIKND